MRIREISSRDNPRFKDFLRLLGGQPLKKHRFSLLSGPKQVAEVLNEFRDRCEALVFSRAHSLPVPQVIEGYCLSAELFREVDVYNTKQPILLVRAEPLPEWHHSQSAQGCTLFVPFQDPANVGAVIRSAAAFGVSRVVILKEGAHPFHHKSIKVAGSAVFRLPLLAGPSIQDLGSEPIPIITLSPGGQDITEYDFPPIFGLVPGMEGPGIPSKLEGLPTLSIPMMSGVESLNAALATGIALFVWRSKMIFSIPS